MDTRLQLRHQALLTALNIDPAEGCRPRWEDYYYEGAVLVKPNGTLLHGRDAIAKFLNGPGLRPIEAELLQAERRGASGYTVATFKIDRKPAGTGTSFTLYTRADGEPPRIVVEVYGGALLPKAFDEWKECLTSIDHLEKLIADVRKFLHPDHGVADRDRQRVCIYEDRQRDRPAGCVDRPHGSCLRSVHR